jgi:hypothetical protein
MWHGCAGTDRRMSRLHWRPPRAGARALPRGMHTRRPRAIAPNPSSSGRKPGRPSPPTRCADVCDRSPPPSCWRRGSVALRGADACDGASAKRPGARRQHYAHREGVRTMLAALQHTPRHATYTAKASAAPCGPMLPSPSASLWLFLRGVWRMVQLSSNVHRATRARNAQHATHKMRHATCNLQHAACNCRMQCCTQHSTALRSCTVRSSACPAQVLAAATLDLDGTVKLLSAKLRKILGAERCALVDTANVTRGTRAALAVLCAPNRRRCRRGDRASESATVVLVCGGLPPSRCPTLCDASYRTLQDVLLHQRRRRA